LTCATSNSTRDAHYRVRVEGEDGANPYTILQKPGAVVISLRLQSHESRHPPGQERASGQGIRLFMGDSIGTWEGNTLVVDTTNFNGRMHTPVSCLT
jgi:hypothetical protein